MGRASLGNLLTQVEEARDAGPIAEPAPESPAPEPPADVDGAPAPSESVAPNASARPRRRPAAEKIASGPKYLELVRKEARFTDAQLDELTIVTRRLNKARRGAGERITDNTLIRVAVDLLLARQADLAGETEDALRKSVGL